MTNYNKRDMEHVKEMRKYHRFNTRMYYDAILADDFRNGMNDLTPHEKRRAKEFIKEHGDEDFYEFIQNDLLEIQFTGVHPMSGGNTRGYGAKELRADSDEFYVVLLMAYGGPSYGIRALATRAGTYGFEFYDVVFVYHDWFCGYEEPVSNPAVWDKVLTTVVDVFSFDEIVALMEENGEYVCANCEKWFERKDEEYYCGNCANTVCNECGEEYDTEDLYEINGTLMCEGCASNNGYSRCEDCANWFTDRDMYDLMTCWDCHLENDDEDDEEE